MCGSDRVSCLLILFALFFQRYQGPTIECILGIPLSFLNDDTGPNRNLKRNLTMHFHKKIQKVLVVAL